MIRMRDAVILFAAGVLATWSVRLIQLMRKELEEKEQVGLASFDEEWMNSPMGPFEKLVMRGMHGVGSTYWRAGCPCDECVGKKATCRGCEEGTCDGQYGSAPGL